MVGKNSKPVCFTFCFGCVAAKVGDVELHMGHYQKQDGLK
jgi:hypothetical protein